MKVFNIEINKRFIPFFIIFVVSSLFFFSEEGSLGLFLFVFAILIFPIALWKPHIAFPFVSNISRKVSTGIAAVLFIVGVGIAPPSASNTTNNLNQVTPSIKNESDINTTVIKSNIKGVESKVEPTATTKPSPTVTHIPTATRIPTATLVPPTSTPILLPTKTPYIPPPTSTPVPVQQQQFYNPPPTTGGFSCNCAKTCGSMSCEEAYFQLACGCDARDGDNDGIPCEAQCR